MRHYHEQISDRMFDFKDYYLKIANKLNNNSVIAEVGAADGHLACSSARHFSTWGKHSSST